MRPNQSGGPELWAGVEGTVNRVGDRYFDQCAWSGHDDRSSDIERLVGLGIKAVRYPVLWEKTAPEPAGPADWSRPDARLGRLRELGVRPIVGLVHHGSGPPHTSLLDPAFAEGLAGYAGRVAERYPWVDAYTPVNEPLTTARFSALYGHWYPHRRDDRAFVTALLTQCRAVVLGMAAVRRVNPAAALVQTEDLGETYAPPALAYQADFDNHRRWLTWDLLCGRVDRRHPLWDYLTGHGASARELDFFRANPCPPDVIGVNHYVTSERYLDDQVDRYPATLVGGNGRDAYVDVEAVRSQFDSATGIAGLLRQTWERYRRPVAVSEAHLGGHREDQVRWLRHVWEGAVAARSAGADVRAVTVWAAFGSFDWDSLVTNPRGHYEPGPFDVRYDPPRPTALAGVTRDLSAGRVPAHPLWEGAGWWARADRFLFADRAAPCLGPRFGGRPVLVTGATGTLGRAVMRIAHARGLAAVGLGRADLDAADPEAVRAALAHHRPWAVVNAAGYVAVDAAESDPERCRRENVFAAGVVATAAADCRLPVVTFSSDLVFDGRADRPYRERDAVAPLNVYGESKAAAEREVLCRHPAPLVVRTSAFFGPWDASNFVYHAVRSLGSGEEFAAVEDVTVSPTYVPDLVSETLDLLIDGATGVWHVAGPDAVTWADLALAAGAAAGIDPHRVRPVPADESGWIAPRPAYSVLGSSLGRRLPPLAETLARWAREGGASH